MNMGLLGRRSSTAVMAGFSAVGRCAGSVATCRGGSRVLLVAAALLSQCRITVAEVYDVEGIKVPQPLSLRVLYFFYVYDNTNARGGANEQSKMPWISFSNIQYWQSGETVTTNALQLILVRYDDVWAMPHEFCCAQQDRRCPVANQIRVHHEKNDPLDNQDVYKMTVASRPKSIKFHINTTSAYALVFSNCGTQDFPNVRLRGRVAVKNPFGYLSGIDHNKLYFFGFLVLIYILLGFVWFFLSVFYRDVLFSIHYAIGVVLALGFFEAVVWFVFYLAINLAGTPNTILYILAVFASVTKCVFSYMLVLAGAMGWGITKPTLTNAELCRIRSLAATFIVLDFARRLMLTFNQSREIPIVFVWCIVVAVAILNATIFFFVFSSLRSLLRGLGAENQTQKLRIFRACRCVLRLALAKAVLSQWVEFVNLSRSIEKRWTMEWFYSDGISHSLFVPVLLAMMVLWKPHANSQRYTYSAHIDDVDMDRNDTSMPGMVPASCDRKIELDDDVNGLLDSQNQILELGGDNSRDSGPGGPRVGCVAASSSSVVATTVGVTPG
eukprot:TRINITY_DN4632_c0_g2_i1.p1 TRINITY_DN4632_c0_g2~~TRINITY_DN4632_c0_g2_i1.p1  ORF type:complete len:554 (-),score=70.89 TRINITY_DN4632_c0_g2_i1:61-1722(-)